MFFLYSWVPFILALIRIFLQVMDLVFLPEGEDTNPTISNIIRSYSATTKKRGNFIVIKDIALNMIVLILKTAPIQVHVEFYRHPHFRRTFLQVRGVQTFKFLGLSL